MTNHPNRGWRTRMHAQCAGWLVRWNFQDAPGARMLTDPELRDLMAQGYRAGYEAGRDSRAPKPHDR
jgi:hypothetical protein